MIGSTIELTTTDPGFARDIAEVQERREPFMAFGRKWMIVDFCTDWEQRTLYPLSGNPSMYTAGMVCKVRMQEVVEIVRDRITDKRGPDVSVMAGERGTSSSEATPGKAVGSNSSPDVDARDLDWDDEEPPGV